MDKRSKSVKANSPVKAKAKPAYLKKLSPEVAKHFDLLEKKLKGQTFLLGHMKIGEKEYDCIQHNAIFLMLHLLQEHRDELKALYTVLRKGRLDLAIRGIEGSLK